MSYDFPEWMFDESIQDIPKKKLEFINSVFHDPAMKNQKNMLIQLPKLVQKAKAENLLFNQDELSRALNAIKKHSTEKELESINKILEKTKKTPAT